MTEVWARDKSADPIILGCTIFRAVGAKAPIAGVADRPEPAKTRWWCVATADGYAGVCFEGEAECSYFREVGRVEGNAFPLCAHRRLVACFTAQPRNGAPDRRCAPDLEKCKTMREAMAREPKRGQLTECEITN